MTTVAEKTLEFFDSLNDYEEMTEERNAGGKQDYTLRHTTGNGTTTGNGSTFGTINYF